MSANVEIIEDGPKSKVEETLTINTILLLLKNDNDSLLYTGKGEPNTSIKTG